MISHIKSAASWFGRFLELRLRAFVYALFTVVGFILGVMQQNAAAIAAIQKYEASVKVAIMEHGK